MEGHRAHLGLRRARRLLRPCPAARRPAARRRRRPEPADDTAGLAAGGPAAPAEGPARPAEAGGHRSAPLRPVRIPGPRGDRVAVRQARSRLQPGARPPPGAQADRAEMEPATADGPGRRSRVTAGRPRPGQPASLPDPAHTARAGPALGWPVAGSAVEPDTEGIAGQVAQSALAGPQVA